MGGRQAGSSQTCVAAVSAQLLRHRAACQGGQVLLPRQGACLGQGRGQWHRHAPPVPQQKEKIDWPDGDAPPAVHGVEGGHLAVRLEGLLSLRRCSSLLRQTAQKTLLAKEDPALHGKCPVPVLAPYLWCDVAVCQLEGRETAAVNSLPPQQPSHFMDDPVSSLQSDQPHTSHE